MINTLPFQKIRQAITILTIMFISIYIFIQVGMRDYYGSFFSYRFLIKGTPDVQSYALDFVKFLKPQHFVFLLYGIVGSILYLKYTQTTTQHVIIPLLLTISSFGLYVSTLILMDPPHIFEKSISLYKNPYYTDIAIHQLGITSFMTTDTQYLLFPNQKIPTVDVDITPKPVEPPVNDTIKNRKFDDQIWKDIQNKETDPTLKNLDQYFLNKPITQRNDHTGIYKDKNFIIFLVEAFDMVAIDEKLTPTLYKLKTEGSYFDRFYSPQFNCATAESEFMSMVSIYPVIGTCSLNAYYDITTPQTLFNLFKKANYETQSYHNWNDQFYERSIIHPTLGSDLYQDVDQTIGRLVSGWQSDLVMMQKVVSDLNEKDTTPQMTYVITSTTHFPYDKDSHLGNKYISKVSEVYPEAPEHIKRYLSKAIELDLAIEYLLTNYKDIDNTVIALFSDHHPLNMPLKYLDTYSSKERSNFRGYDNTPFIIYSHDQTPEIVDTPASTIDILPTIANLFDFEHDPRLFLGTDIYSDEENIIIFQEGSWIDANGMFSVRQSKYIPFNESRTLQSEEIDKKNNLVRQKLSISSQIYQSKYFKHRPHLQNRFNPN